MKRILTLIILFIGFILLLLYVIYVEKPVLNERLKGKTKLLGMKREEINWVYLKFHDYVDTNKVYQVAVERVTDDVWVVVEPRKDKANMGILNFMLNNLVDLIGEFAITNPSPEELKDYGLTEPFAIIKVRGERAKRVVEKEFWVGNTVAAQIEDQQYLLDTQNTNLVYIVSAPTISSILKTPSELRNRKIIEDKWLNPDKFSILVESGDIITLEKHKDKWVMVSPVKKEDIDNKKVEDFLNSLPNIQVKHFSDIPKTEQNINEYRLNNPKYFVKIWKGGEYLELLISSKVDKENLGIYAMDNTRDYIYEVDEFYRNYFLKSISSFEKERVETKPLYKE